MRLGRIALGTLVAAAALAMPAPAQAQESMCFDNTGTNLDGKCLNGVYADENGNVCAGRTCLPTGVIGGGGGGGGLCVGRYCVTGLEENIEALRRLIEERLPDIDPDEWFPICTPHLFSGPICVG